MKTRQGAVQFWGKATRLRITVPAILLVALFVTGLRAEKITVSYLDQWFATDVDEEAAHNKLAVSITGISQQVERLSSNFSSYVRRQNIVAINQRIASTEREIRLLQTEIEELGRNGRRAEQLETLREYLRMLRAEKTCLMDDTVIDKSNCDLE